MSRLTYFVQECPTCGRSLQVRVEYLGRQVACQHCHGCFEAVDPTNSRRVPHQRLNLLDRADQLLEAVEQHRDRPVS
jgi:hypothetical protein